MDDNLIIDLYWKRCESAIAETSAKYGRYCRKIAYDILADAQDAEESVNDTYLDAWNAMPPHRPVMLSTFLGKLTRRISIDRWRGRTAEKRGGGEIPLTLDELADCVPSEQDVERTVEARELTAAVNAFLSQLPDHERDVFVCRYFFLLPLSEICEKFRYSPSKTKSMLSRTRKKLLAHFKKEGLV